MAVRPEVWAGRSASPGEGGEVCGGQGPLATPNTSFMNKTKLHLLGLVWHTWSCWSKEVHLNWVFWLPWRMGDGAGKTRPARML